MTSATEALNAEIALRTAGLLVGRSLKTLQRWCDDGKLPSRVVDLRGKRVTTVAGVLPFTALAPDDACLVVWADAGDTNAQNELGVALLALGKYQLALGWFQAAARRGHADAMHWLSKYYFSGSMGVNEQRDIAMKWLAAAAAQGHAIAKAQMRALPARIYAEPENTWWAL
jgi:TPR repeat protein